MRKTRRVRCTLRFVVEYPEPLDSIPAELTDMESYNDAIVKVIQKQLRARKRSDVEIVMSPLRGSFSLDFRRGKRIDEEA